MSKNTAPFERAIGAGITADSAADEPGPLLGVDHIRDHQDLWHEPRPNVWVLPAAIVAVVVIVSVYAALFRWVL